MYDRWSLEVLYSGFEDEKFKKDLERVDELILEYQKFAETLGKEGKTETVQLRHHLRNKQRVRLRLSS